MYWLGLGDRIVATGFRPEHGTFPPQFDTARHLRGGSRPHWPQRQRQVDSAPGDLSASASGDRGNPRQAAQRTAAVPQERPADFAVTVAEMGRTPHKRPFAGDSVEDRALVARALAQQAQVLILILDEPTNHLDVRYQLELLELVRDLDLTVIMAMHDLNLAATYCDRLHVIASGRLTSGTPSEVLTEDLLRDVFSVGAEITHNARNAKLQLCFYPLTPVDKSTPESICSTHDGRAFT